MAFHVILDETFPGAPPGWPNDRQGVAHGLSGSRLSVPQGRHLVAAVVTVTVGGELDEAWQAGDQALS